MGNFQGKRDALDDEHLKEAQKGLMDVVDTVASVLNGCETIAGACRSRDLCMTKTRRIIKLAMSVHGHVQNPLKIGVKKVYLTPVERLYKEVFDSCDEHDGVLDCIPPHADETVAEIFGDPERFGIDPMKAEILWKHMKGATLEGLGEEYGRCKERIRQIVNMVFRQLRSPRLQTMLMYGTGYTDEREKIYQQKKAEAIEKYVQERMARDADVRRAKGEPNPDLRISDIGLSVRAYNCLSRHGVKTVEDITKISWEELSRFRNLGHKSAKEIIEAVRVYYPDYMSDREEIPVRYPKPSEACAEDSHTDT